MGHALVDTFQDILIRKSKNKKVERCGKPIFSLIFNDPAWQDLGCTILNGGGDMTVSRASSEFGNQPQQTIQSEMNGGDPSNVLEPLQKVLEENYFKELGHRANHRLTYEFPKDYLKERFGTLFADVIDQIILYAHSHNYGLSFDKNKKILVFSGTSPDPAEVGHWRCFIAVSKSPAWRLEQTEPPKNTFECKIVPNEYRSLWEPKKASCQRIQETILSELPSRQNQGTLRQIGELGAYICRDESPSHRGEWEIRDHATNTRAKQPPTPSDI
ncbi:MAG: hypothetical protein WCF19_02670 [Chlamydiales bacterium]